MNQHPASSSGSCLIDADSGLFHEPRLLQDARFLGALHTELEAELGAPEAASTLFQLGLFQGLCGATRLLRFGFFERCPDPRALPISPLLAMRFRPPSRDLPHGRVEVRGSWPEQKEASGRVSALGAGSETACFASAGYTSGWLSGLLEVDLLALESSCSARGDGACQFIAREPAAWRALGDPRAEPLLDALDYAALRQLVAAEIDTAPPPPTTDVAFDPGSPVVHVWGPVMVIPFAGADASLQAVELVRRDAAAASVKVVVVDLSDVILDEGFGAVALERLIDAIQSLGAEPILSGVSPLCAPLVADLEGGQVLVEKDLFQAIAVAFQIADAQRRAI